MLHDVLTILHDVHMILHDVLMMLHNVLMMLQFYVFVTKVQFCHPYLAFFDLKVVSPESITGVVRPGNNK
jgi:hypothetical protein